VDSWTIAQNVLNTYCYVLTTFTLPKHYGAKPGDEAAHVKKIIYPLANVTRFFMVVTYMHSKMRYIHICLSVCLYTCCLPVSLSICSIACIYIYLYLPVTCLTTCTLMKHYRAKPRDEAAHVKEFFSLWQML
jgi:hypothetical protein